MSKNQKYINDEYIPRSKRLSNNNKSERDRKIISSDDIFDDDEDIYAELKCPPSKSAPAKKSNSGGANQKKRPPAKAPAKNHKIESEITEASVPVSNKKKSRHPVLKFLKNALCVLLVLYFIAVVTVYSVLGKVNYTKETHTWEDSIASGAPDWELTDSMRVENILLLGIDGNVSKGRSDTMIILSIDRITRQIKLTSLLRDLYVSIPGRGQDRLNAAFAYGGPSLLMQTIECNFRIKIDKYVCVNFTSFESIISAIGGVTINLTDAEAKYINKFIPGALTGGEQRLNAAQAVFYARIRQIDSDFGRTSRQRTLLEALANECKTLKISQLIDLIKLLSPYLDTNIDRLALASLAVEGISCMYNEIQECSIPVKGGYSSQTIRGMSVLVPNLEQNCTVLHEFIFGKIPQSLS